MRPLTGIFFVSFRTAGCLTVLALCVIGMRSQLKSGLLGSSSGRAGNWPDGVIRCRALDAAQSAAALPH